MKNTEEKELNKKEAKNMKKKKGFTLIELIAVIAILGILAAILVPNIIGYTNKAKVGKAITDAGIIMRAIDAYEADNSELAITAQLVQKTDPTNIANYEGSLTLGTLITNDTNGNKKIFGAEAPVAVNPAEWNGSAALALTIDTVRQAALKTKTVTIANNLVTSVN